MPNLPRNSGEVPSPAGPIVPDSEAVAKATEIELNLIQEVEVDSNTRNEQKQIEQDQQKALALERERLTNVGLQQDIDARKEYALRIYRLIVAWISAILFILLLNGFLGKSNYVFSVNLFFAELKTVVRFELSDPVLLALIGGTTASVLGLFVIVANYLFPKK